VFHQMVVSDANRAAPVVQGNSNVRCTYLVCPANRKGGG